MSEAAWLIIGWLFVVGAAVGSFLNVVVYRLPLGLSLIHPPSHCPKCEKRIPWYDNVPILGWIMLRGRCRQCGNAISPRYPIVEAITAAMFAAVAVAELPYLCQTGVFGVYPFHMLLLCTLLCAGLIAYDGECVPWKLFVPALVVGAVAPIFCPALRAIAVWGQLPTWLAGTVDGLAGLAAGAMLGSLAGWALGYERSNGLTPGLVSVGLFLGWQAVGIIAIGMAGIEYSQRVVRPAFRIAPSRLLPALTLAWILIWGAVTSCGQVG
jgi:leader peptidase (prepilin peptidase) / N-methyltransferase